jgi:hypothetical protein
VTRPANSNRLLVTLYMLFESVRFFGLAVFPSVCSCECGSAHGCSPHCIDALHIRRLASGESIFMGNVVQTVVTKPANMNSTLVTLYVLFESVRCFSSRLFSSLCVWSRLISLTMHLQTMLDSFIGAADEVSRVCAACS